MGQSWGNFKKLTATAPPYRLICRSYGMEKVGKSHFGLTGPGPVAILSFDVGLEGVVEKFVAAGTEVFSTEYEFDKNSCTQDDAQVLRNRFEEDYARALVQARTIQIDTESELWEVYRYAEFGSASDAPRNYVALNARYRDLIQRAYDKGVNLQLIQKMKEKWTVTDAGKPTPSGVMESVGFKEAGYIVQVNLRHSWEKGRGFITEVLNCRQNMGVAGTEHVNLTLPELGQMVFPDSSEVAWG